MQEQEENIQPKDIAGCRAEFYDSLIRVQGVLDRASRPRAAAPAPQRVQARAAEPAPAPPAGAMPRQTIELVIYFPFDSADLTPANLRTVKSAAARIKRLGADRILVIGHADRAGNLSYNLTLSDRRGASVRAALMAEGIFMSKIHVESYGEAQPADATADGVASVRNRRVTVSF